MRKVLFATSIILLASNVGYSQKANHKKSHKSSKGAATNSFKTTSKGLGYKFIEHGKGKQKAGVGDFITFNMQQYVRDSMLFDTKTANKGEPVTMPVRPLAFNGDVMEGFSMMVAGDSAIFLLPVDSMIKMNPQLPPFLHKGDKIEFRVRMINVKTKAQMDAEHAANAAKQNEVDDKKLQAYFKEHNIKAQKTASGLYYKIEEQGSGENVKSGDKVTVNYTGKLLDGTTFDSNVDSNFHHVQPFSFSVGQHQVIEGWDEGLQLLKKGSKATLYIPSSMAYGERSPSPAIPANSILVFDVEVTGIN